MPSPSRRHTVALSRHADPLELPDLLRDGRLNRQPLHRRRAVEAVHVGRTRLHVLGVLGHRDRPAVREHEHMRVDLKRGVGDLLHARHRLVERERRACTDRSFGGEPHVGDDDVCPGGRHLPRLAHVESVGRRQQAESTREADHVDLEAVRHAGLLEVLPEDTVHQADRREVLRAREAQRLDRLEQLVHPSERVRRADPREQRRPPEHWQNLLPHLEHHRVRVLEGQQPGERAVPAHPEPARVVDDDEVSAARLLELGRDASARARANDGLPPRRHLAQPLEDGVARAAPCGRQAHGRVNRHARRCGGGGGGGDRGDGPGSGGGGGSDDGGGGGGGSGEGVRASSAFAQTPQERPARRSSYARLVPCALCTPRALCHHAPRAVPFAQLDGCFIRQHEWRWLEVMQL
mmetsp:Transcript_26439/g.61680  ORF Transcript_26439/g.61680 Transcript_26439/m.61680 type:complete len:406 (-) Transcript_26439:1383-2600(-)